MSHSGEELGADLVDLYDAGRYKVGAVADQFRRAGGDLNGAAGYDGLFIRNPVLGGTYGPAKASWDTLRDAVVDVLATTATNLEDTGHALVMAADEYAGTDQAAAATYRELKAALDQSHGVS